MSMQVTSMPNGQITFSHGKDTFNIVLHRTLRIPENGKTHNLPPSLGYFPVKTVDDYKDTVPKSWVEHGGIFIPMWQREAMWLGFEGGRRPAALKIAAGKINAVSGKPWNQEISEDENDYLVAPPQPWLDGFNTGNGTIKQFVAMPLGQGYTVEGQVTGEEKFGGIQMICFFPKDDLLVPKQPTYRGSSNMDFCGLDDTTKTLINEEDSYPVAVAGCAAAASEEDFKGFEGSRGITISGQNCTGGASTGGSVRMKRSRPLTKAAEMGLAAGGQMKQKIYPDPHGVDTWNQQESGRIYIHIVNSEMYQQITGEAPPATPISAKTYADHGYTWYDLYDEHMGDTPASPILGTVKSVSQVDQKHGFTGQQDDTSVNDGKVVKYPMKSGEKTVRNGNW